MTEPEDVLRFWLEEVGEDGWFSPPEGLDERVRDGFEGAWVAAMEGRLGGWMATPRGALAMLVLLDQLPRNMFRGDPLSFASDPQARVVAKTAMSRGWDLRATERERQFFYLPLEHSENLVDQDRAVRLFRAHVPSSPGYLLHARAHREQIRLFGRFPTRNATLGRQSTPAEADWLAQGGYPALVQRMAA